MNLTELSKVHHEQMKRSGFYNEPPDFCKQIALLHSEVSEALQADRISRTCTNEFAAHFAEHNDKPFKVIYEAQIKDTLPQELAGIILRTLDIAASRKIDIQKFIDLEMRYNKLRDKKHGKKY